MMTDIKNCFKLLKYGYQVKTNALCSLLFVGIGIVFLMMGDDQLALCSMYLFLAVMVVSQSMYMMLFSEWVAASPKRKQVEFLYMDILHIVGGAVAIVVILLVTFIRKPEPMEGITVEAMLVISGWMAIALYCYMSMSYKYMVLGTVLFMVTFFFVVNATGSWVSDLLSKALEGRLALAVAIFIAEVVLGIVLAHEIRKLVYRKEMSKWALTAQLRMEQS